jgi:uncharacterized protein (TIGR02246 family)
MSAAAIATNNRAFEHAVETGNVEAIGALLAPDIVSLPPDSPIVSGRDAVKQLWASAITEYGMTSFRITTDNLDVVGDLASEVGRATMTMAPPGGKSETTTIKYLVVWKQLNGKWLLHRDIYNALPE